MSSLKHHGRPIFNNEVSDSWNWKIIKNVIWNLLNSWVIVEEEASKILRFLSSQIKYTSMDNETLRILEFTSFLHAERFLAAAWRERKFRVIPSQFLIEFHNSDVQEHWKNRCLWDSGTSPHRAQVESIAAKVNLSLVLSLPFIANHNMKECFRRDQLSQTPLFQFTRSPLGLRSE